MALQYLYNIKGRTPTGNNSCSFFISNICSMSTICPFYEWDSIYLTRNIYIYIYIYILIKHKLKYPKQISVMIIILGGV